MARVTFDNWDGIDPDILDEMESAGYDPYESEDYGYSRSYLNPADYV